MSSFFIWSALSSNTAGSYGLNVDGYNSSPGTPIILYPWTGGRANELWTLDSDNHLITGLGSDLVIGIDSSNAIVLCTLSTGDPSQQWILSNGMLQNQQNNMVISAAGDSESGYTLTLIDLPTTPSPNQIWQYADNLPMPVTYMPQWNLFQGWSQASGSVFLDVGEFFAVAWNAASGADSQNWIITPDGRILNSDNVNWLLTTQNGTSDLMVLNQSQPLSSSQQWTYGADYIANVGSGQYIDIGSNGSAIVAPPPPPSSFWITKLPPDPLTPVATAGPQPFSDFQITEGQSQAYAYIVQTLNQQGYFTGDLRATYTNLDFTANFASWGVEIESGIPCPEGISQADWGAVCTQLSLELQAVAATQTLLINYQVLHDGVFSAQQAMVSSNISLLQLEDTVNVNGHAWMICDNIFYTILESIPFVNFPLNPFAIFGNLLQSVINITTAVTSGPGQVPPDPFQKQVSEYWDQLLDNFTAILTSTGDVFTAILSDWGKLSATYALINATGPDSLNWQPDTYNQVVSGVEPGFFMATIQMLMPGKYMIYSKIQDSDSPLSGIPAQCQTIVSYPDQGVWIVSWVGDRSNQNSYPDPDDVMGVIFKNTNGYPPQEFFQAAGSWGFLMAETGSAGCGSSFVNVTLSNQSYQLLNVAMDPKDAGLKGATLAPYGSASIGDSWGGEGLNMYFSVYDPMISTTSDPVITFEVTLTSETGSVPQVLNLSTNSGYYVSPPLINLGTDPEWSWGTVSSVQMSVRYYPPSSTPPQIVA
jgi:hypothetical protein